MKLNLLVFVLADISFSYAGNKFAGPFNVQVKQPVICEDEGTKEIYFNETTIRKKSKNLYVLSTKITMSKPLDDSLTMTGNFAVWGNGGWRPNFLTMNYKNACTSFGTLVPAVFQNALEYNNLTGCPVLPGTYMIREADASPHVGMDSLPYNKYKVNIYFSTEAGVNIGCLGMIAQIVPKDKKG